jgi:hypothetical protein
MIKISAVTGEGLDALKHHIFGILSSEGEAFP